MEDKRKEILQLLSVHGYLSIKDLAKRIYVSESTVRRALRDLESAQWITRTRGGASILSPARGEMPLAYSVQKEAKVKREIAKRAASMVPNKCVVFLSSSSISLFMIPHLAKIKELIIITDGLYHAQVSADAGIKTYCLGGIVNSKARSCEGLYAEMILDKLHVNMLFFSAPCVSLSGEITHYSMEKTTILRSLIKCADKVCLLCNSGKIGTRKETFQICRTSDIDTIICDVNLPDSLPRKKQFATDSGV